MKKAKFIINPSSGKQNFLKNIESIIGCMVMNQVVNQVDIFYTKGDHDARDVAKSLKKGEYDFIVSVGGDGTLNDVVNGLVQSGSEIPLAVISSGTVNDFATFLHLPQTTKAFCKMIMEFKTEDVDVGKINDEYFINVVAGGMWADVGYKVPKESKAVLGKLAYYLEGAKDLPKNAFRSIKLSFESEEYCAQDEDVIVFIVTNSGSVGGFRTLVPTASVSDGMFDVIVLKSMDIGQFTTLGIQLLKGEHLNHPKVEYFKTNHLKIGCGEQNGVPIDFDGEMFGELPIDLTVLKGAIKLLVP